MISDKTTIFDVIIIGSGPAGFTAGIYTIRAGLKTLIIAGIKWGGQLMNTTEVENYPGFPEGIQGPLLMENMRKQVERLGVEIVNSNFTHGDFSSYPFVIQTEDKKYQGKAVILATGADSIWLDVPGEKKLRGKGVSVCATCDGFFFRDKDVIVVGGGDSAMEEAQFIAKFAKTVTIVHRKGSFRASKAMQNKVFSNPKIKVIWNSQLVRYIGEDKLTSVVLKDLKSGKEEERKIDGVFVAIGHKPNTQKFQGIETDAKGYAKKISNFQFPISGFKWLKEEKGDWRQIALTYPSLTSVEGVFTAGDVHDFRYRQAVTAAGFGCMAALDVQRWLTRG